MQTQLSKIKEYVNSLNRPDNIIYQENELLILSCFSKACKIIEETNNNYADCLLSILDSLKLYDNGSLELGDETLSEMMFRKMKGYNIDLNKELGFDHLKPITKNK